MSCTRCGEDSGDQLYAVLDDDTRLCVDCWQKAGRPWPRLRSVADPKREEAMTKAGSGRGRT